MLFKLTGYTLISDPKLTRLDTDILIWTSTMMIYPVYASLYKNREAKIWFFTTRSVCVLEVGAPQIFLMRQYYHTTLHPYHINNPFYLYLVCVTCSCGNPWTIKKLDSSWNAVYHPVTQPSINNGSACDYDNHIFCYCSTTCQ